MRFNVGIDKSYEEIKSSLKEYSMIPGNEDGITEEEYNGINEMIDRIIQYYQGYFECEPYSRSDKTYDCLIRFDFRGGFDGNTIHIEKEEPSRNLNSEDVESMRSLFGGGKFKRDALVKTIKKSLADINDYEEGYDRKYDYEMTNFMRKVFSVYITDAGLDENRFREYLEKVDERIEALAQKLTDTEKLLHDENADSNIERFMDGRDEDIVDPWGTYSCTNKTVTLYWPRICLKAKIRMEEHRAKGKDISEKDVKWCCIEEVLAHELFHFFHNCCSEAAGSEFEIKNENKYEYKCLGHMQECLAEFFSAVYMTGEYRIGNRIYEYRWRNGDEFNPDSEDKTDTDGGYSGSDLLMRLIYMNSKSKNDRKEMKYNNTYVDILEKSLFPGTSVEACDILMQYREEESEVNNG